MARAVAVAVLLVAAAVCGTQASLVLTQKLNDFPVLPNDFAATAWLIADPSLVVDGAGSTSRVGFYGFGDEMAGSCPLMASECEDQIYSRGVIAALPTSSDLAGVYATNIADQVCMAVRWDPLWNGNGTVIVRVLADPAVSFTRLSLQYYFFNDQPGSVSLSVLGTNELASEPASEMLLMREISGFDAAPEPMWSAGSRLHVATGTPANMTHPAYYYLRITCTNCTGTVSDAVALCNMVARGSSTPSFDAPPTIPPTICAEIVQPFSSWNSQMNLLFVSRVASVSGIAESDVTILNVTEAEPFEGQDVTRVCFRVDHMPWYKVANMIEDAPVSAFGWDVVVVYREDKPTTPWVFGLSGGAVAGILLAILVAVGLITAGIVLYVERRRTKRSGASLEMPMEELPSEPLEPNVHYDVDEPARIDESA